MAFTSFKVVTTSIFSLLALAGSAQATLFSFASDDDSTHPTFRGTAAAGMAFGITHDTAGTAFGLKIDDNNGANPTVTLNVNFRANLSATFVNSIGLAGAQTFLYSVTGSFSFLNPTTGATLLTGTIGGAGTPAALTILGTTTTWGSSGSLFDSDTAYNVAGAVTWTATPGLSTYAQSTAGANLANYGIDPGGGSSSTPDDFSFTLTNLNSGGGPVPINSTSRLPTAAWTSESSFSGSAINGIIPTPGAFTLIGLAGLMAMGRRRR